MLPLSTLKNNLIVVLGPTASGKTRLGVVLARACGGEIVSADSRQVYRGLTIGAGKDLAEYGEAPNAVPYHLIDVAGLDEEYSVFRFQRECFDIVSKLLARGSTPVIVGGTGLYLEAVLNRYRMVEAPENEALRNQLAAMDDDALRARLAQLKPHRHNTTDTTDRARLIRAIEIAEHSRTHEPDPAPDFKPIVLGVRWPRDELRVRIANRLNDRMENGLIGEVEGLIQQGILRDKLQFLGLEYRYVDDFLRGRIKSNRELLQLLHTAIAQFAKRQETWFRRMERNGLIVHWIDRGGPKAAIAALAALGIELRDESAA